MVTIEGVLNEIYNLPSVALTEIVSLEQALNRVCAKDYLAKFDMPRFDNSAMDGYEIKPKQASSNKRVQY